MAAARIQLVALFTRVVVMPGIVIGVVGNSLNIAVLRRASLYNHPCSRYFLALSGNNLFFSIFLFTYNLFAVGYQMDLVTTSPLSCKIILYTQHFSVWLSPYFIVLASFDRFCGSSTSVRIRNLSNLKFARWSILSVIMFYALFFISSFVLLELTPGQLVPCRLSTATLYGRIYPIIQAVLLSVVPTFLMMGFGLLTIKNATSLQVMPAVSVRYRRTESQLARMLFAQVICHFLLSTPSMTIYVLGFLPVQYLSPIEYYVAFRITQVIYSISYTASVFLYFLSAAIYRKELLIILKSTLWLKRPNRTLPITIKRERIPMTMDTTQISRLRKQSDRTEQK